MIEKTLFKKCNKIKKMVFPILAFLNLLFTGNAMF